jgi:hypothetical protein
VLVVLSIALCVQVLLAETAAAQFADQVVAGASIRYRTSLAPDVQSNGTVTRRTADTLFVAGEGRALQALGLQDVSKMDLRVTGKSHKFLYGAIGLVAGGVLGAVVGATQKTSCNESTAPEIIGCTIATGITDAVAPVAFGFVGGLLGTATGIIVGAHRSSSWQPVIQ